MYKNGKRTAISLACWGIASIGVLSSFMFFGSAVISIVAGSADSPSDYIGLGIPIAWLSLGVMTKEWIRNSRAHWLWVILGTVVGLPLAIAFIPFIAFYFSLAGFAIYLGFWHLHPKHGPTENA